MNFNPETNSPKADPLETLGINDSNFDAEGHPRSRVTLADESVAFLSPQEEIEENKAIRENMREAMGQ